MKFNNYCIYHDLHNDRYAIFFKVGDGPYSFAQQCSKWYIKRKHCENALNRKINEIKLKESVFGNK